METFSTNLVSNLLFIATFFLVLLRTYVELRAIFRKYKANQRNARDAKDELTDIPAYDVNRARRLREELFSLGYYEAYPGIFAKSVKPNRGSASTSTHGRDPIRVA